jgi:GNAT superfamily N-acetyltransferase
MSTTVRPLEPGDLPWAEQLVAGFGGRMAARLGTVVDALSCEALVAVVAGEPAGILTYLAGEDGVEIVYIQSAVRFAGVGTALVEALAEEVGGRRLWLVTTNDNLDALRFYQRRGFRIVGIRPGAVDEARRSLKPSIPALGNHGIAIRDEIVLERYSVKSGAAAATTGPGSGVRAE